MTVTERYGLSFTTGGLLLLEGSQALEAFAASDDWRAARSTLLERNVLQQRTRASAVRLVGEVIARVQTLEGDYLRILRFGALADRQVTMWIAACRRYRLISQFAEEVITPRLAADQQLLQRDFEIFWLAQLEWHPELANVSTSTFLRLRQNLFRMLREAGAYAPDGRLARPLVSSQVLDLLENAGQRDAPYALVSRTLGAH